MCELYNDLIKTKIKVDQVKFGRMINYQQVILGYVLLFQLIQRNLYHNLNRFVVVNCLFMSGDFSVRRIFGDIDIPGIT